MAPGPGDDRPDAAENPAPRHASPAQGARGTGAGEPATGNTVTGRACPKDGRARVPARTLSTAFQESRFRPVFPVFIHIHLYYEYVDTNQPTEVNSQASVIRVRPWAPLSKFSRNIKILFRPLHSRAVYSFVRRSYSHGSATSARSRRRTMRRAGNADQSAWPVRARSLESRRDCRCRN